MLHCGAKGTAGDGAGLTRTGKIKCAGLQGNVSAFRLLQPECDVPSGFQ